MKKVRRLKARIFGWKVCAVCGFLMGFWILACAAWDENPYPIYILVLALVGCVASMACAIELMNDDEAELKRLEKRQKAVPVPKIRRHSR